MKILSLIHDENLDCKFRVKMLIRKLLKVITYSGGINKLNINTKKLLFNCFVRCHLLYGLVVWGGAKNTVISPLVKTKNISKIWSKIGNKYMHTKNRIEKYSILNLKDESLAQESKFLWHCNKENSTQ